MSLDAVGLGPVDACWRAANYLSVGQIHLLDNPLSREPLDVRHIRPRLLGHWGTTPGLSFVYARLNRVIQARNLEVRCVIGPGHNGPRILANTWLEGSYTEAYPDVPRDERGMRTLFRQGGELGYSLVHAYGADPDRMRRDMAAAALDTVFDGIHSIQRAARTNGGGTGQLPRWPLIVPRSPKGWTSPSDVDGMSVEATWRILIVNTGSSSRVGLLISAPSWPIRNEPVRGGRRSSAVRALCPTRNSRAAGVLGDNTRPAGRDR